MFFRRKEQSHSSAYVWLVAGLVFLVKTAWLGLTSIRGLASTSWLIDDSFIEMRIAENLGHGAGFSLDGIHSTTGAPFLWIYLTSINHMLFGRDLAIRMTLIESALLAALATIVVFHLALKLTEDRRVAWTAFILSTFTASAFLNGMNGMDTALFTLLVLLSIALCLGVGRPKSWSPFAWGSLTGLAAGLTVMTRGDGIFLIFSLACVLAYNWWKAPRGERKEHAHSLAGLLLVSGVCFALFMTWQLVQTGSPFPGNQVGRQALAYALHDFSYAHFSLPKYLAIVGWNVFQLEELLTIATGGFLLCIVAYLFGCTQKRLRGLNIITAVYVGVFFALLVGYQWYFANVHGVRYINPAVHIFFIYAAYLVWQLPADAWKKWVAGGAVLSMLVLANYKFYQMCSRLPWAPYMSFVGHPDPEKAKQFWGTMDWMNEHIKPGTIVGIRDYGRASMFVNVLIQDIAGNVDPTVVKRLADGTLDQYLKERNVEYLLIPSLDQRSDELYQYLHKNLHLEQVKDAPESPTQKLYKIIW